MSVSRVWKWKCDFCETIFEREESGFPPGFGYTKEKILRHGCVDCQIKNPDIAFFVGNKRIKVKK